MTVNQLNVLCLGVDTSINQVADYKYQIPVCGSLPAHWLPLDVTIWGTHRSDHNWSIRIERCGDAEETKIYRSIFQVYGGFQNHADAYHVMIKVIHAMSASADACRATRE